MERLLCESISLDVPGYRKMASSSEFNMGGIVALVHKSIADQLVNEQRLPVPRNRISGFWKMDLSYEDIDLAQQNVRLTDHVQKYFETGCLNAHELQIKDKSQLRPNQYSRPAYLQIMEAIQHHREENAGYKCELEDYVLVGGIERVCRKFGYDIANCGIFGGFMKRGETSIQCAIRKLKFEFLVDFRDEVTTCEVQKRIRSDLGISGLPLYMGFRGQLPRQRSIENMQAWVVIFPHGSIRTAGETSGFGNVQEDISAAINSMTLHDRRHPAQNSSRVSEVHFSIWISRRAFLINNSRRCSQDSRTMLERVRASMTVKELVESFKRNPSANFFRKVDANLATSVVSITTWEAIFVALAIRPCQVRKG